MKNQRFFLFTASLLCCSALLFYTCINPVSDETPAPPIGENEEWTPDSEEEDDGNEYIYTTDPAEAPLKARDIVFVFNDNISAIDLDTTKAGESAGSLTLPEGWTASLVEGWGDSDYFELEPEADEENNTTVNVKIKQDITEWGVYKAGLTITNLATEDTVNKQVSVYVTETPRAYPWIVDVGKNKLIVRWDESPPAGWTGINLYINTENNAGTAKKYKSYAKSDTEYTSRMADVTYYPGGSPDDGLPDGTSYYVWLRGVNSAGEGAFSVGSRTKTSATLHEKFYTDDNGKTFPEFFAWDSFYGDPNGSGDHYVIYPPKKEFLSGSDRIFPGGILSYAKINGGGFRGEIVYFGCNQNNAPQTSHSKWGESLAGSYGGWFLIRYHDWCTKDTSKGSGTFVTGTKYRRYMSVIFYGLDAVQTAGPPEVTTGPNHNPRGLKECYFGNSWLGVNPERDTFEQIYDQVMREGKAGIYYIATPWYHQYTPNKTIWYGSEPYKDYAIGGADKEDIYYKEDGKTPNKEWTDIMVKPE